ncbi:MAG TPA: aldo/keto reductase [Candidatus Tectomicrobia bacterium]|jgi:aryl-alcohol dehydrogenase-like predicted oxidoreductase
MEYRQLGRAGVRVSVIGLGTNRFGTAQVPQAEVTRILDAAVDLGINFIDASDTYVLGRCEETLGQALKGRWDRFVVATKGGLPMGEGPNDRGASRYHIVQALEASLCRLQSDHVDVYYMHRWDPTTPTEETLRALDDLIRQGKIGYIGASAYAAWQLAQANMLADLRGWIPFVVLQSEYNMFQRQVEQEVLPYCRAADVGFVPYAPLAGGFLTGKYQRGTPPPAGSRGESSPNVQRYMTTPYYDAMDALAAWAAARRRGMNELAQAWLMAQPQVCSVITGATRLEHVLHNVQAASWALTSAEVDEVNALLP